MHTQYQQVYNAIHTTHGMPNRSDKVHLRQEIKECRPTGGDSATENGTPIGDRRTFNMQVG